MYQTEKEIAPLIGRTVIFVDQQEHAHGSVTLYCDDRTAFAFVLEADCCSHSEYTPEGIAAFKELIGARILKIEERTSQSYAGPGAVVIDADFQARETKLAEKYPAEETDSWHFLVFITNKGHVTVDWRNMSNGYYDGNCSVIQAAPLPGPVHDLAIELTESPGAQQVVASLLTQCRTPCA